MMIGTWRIICAESYIWLVVWNMNFMTFPSYWECHHPNWLSYFSEGLVGIPPTSFFLHFSKPPTSIIDIPYTLWLFNVASGKWPIYRWFTMVYRLKVVAKNHQPAQVIPRPHDPNCARTPEFWQKFCGFIRPDGTNHRTWYQPWDLCKSMISMSCHDPWRIHGAGIYANIKGVYWWDPCYHIYIYHTWIRHGWDVMWFPVNIWKNTRFHGKILEISHEFRPHSCGRWPEGPLCSGAADDSWLLSFFDEKFHWCVSWCWDVWWCVLWHVYILGTWRFLFGCVGLGAKACEKQWGLLQIQINADGVKQKHRTLMYVASRSTRGLWICDLYYIGYLTGAFYVGNGWGLLGWLLLVIMDHSIIPYV